MPGLSNNDDNVDNRNTQNIPGIKRIVENKS